MAKVIHTILSLRDNMSGGLVKVAQRTKGVNKEMVSATRSVVAFGKKAEASISKVVKKTVKWGAVTATAVAGLAAKTGFSEAMDLEGYRLQLETATKDTQKASKIMTDAINLANRTPFEGGELVEGAAKFEAMGMSAETWLSRAGDMAAATNKSFDQAVEALIDAQTGELERLKEFGITKAKIVEQGEKMFAGVQIVNNKGQIENQEKFNEALVALMEDRFAGGMEKQATTMKGLWSTVTGVTKSALATIVGISTDGSIKAGSALDLLKGKVQLLADRLQQWQQDGTIDKVAQMFTDGLGRAVEYAGRAFRWIVDNGDTIRRWVVGLGAAFAGVKIVQFVSGVVSAIKTIRTFASVAMAIVSANPITLAIGAAIAAGLLLIANWDKVKAYFHGLWAQFAEGWAVTKESIVGAFNGAKEAVGNFFGWFGDKLNWLDDKISKIPVLGSLYTKAKSGISGWINKEFSGINWGFGGHATGTSYFPGGWTRINERGGEIVNLPGGTKIIPHDVSQRMAGGQTVNVYVTVQGNMIGNKAYADYMGNVVAQRLLRALRNT
nr:MAG TPA: tail tape measure [Caudoviricetes sp.]